MRAGALAVLAASAAAQTCAPGSPSVYGPLAGAVKTIAGAPLNFSAFAGTVTLFTNVASF